MDDNINCDICDSMKSSIESFKEDHVTQKSLMEVAKEEDLEYNFWYETPKYTSEYSEFLFTNFKHIYASLTSYPSSIFLIVFLLPTILYVIYFICNYLSTRIKKRK